ncbi:MAG TPA: D-arabinono-1,4-lactone oxidase [Verrucomicrobiae bacterium]
MSQIQNVVANTEASEAGTIVNDFHSRLNATAVRRIVRPESLVQGYGLFGAIYAVTLQLVRRQSLRRVVEITETTDLMEKFDAAIRRGALYGDFQFAIDPKSDDFLKRGVFTVYEPASGEQPDAQQKALLTEDWERLLHLAHVDKSAGFREYSAHYRSTHGQVYWSDAHQMSYYAEGYHERLDRRLGSSCAGSEMISELYVPRRNLAAFLHSVRIFARRYGWNIIYGTVRLIERDEETALAWARESWACVVFNLCVRHCESRIEEAKFAFRTLAQIAINYGGSYYLTYHKWATRDQLLACFPQFSEFLKAKRRYDPDELFVSNWYEALRDQFSD